MMSLRLLFIVLMVCVGWLSGGILCHSAIAADPAFVGSLATAVEPAMAEQLGLSAETKTALIDLIDKRETEALELALEIKSLPRDQQEARLAPFRAESERQGLKLLSDAQRTKFVELSGGNDSKAPGPKATDVKSIDAKSPDTKGTDTKATEEEPKSAPNAIDASKTGPTGNTPGASTPGGSQPGGRSGRSSRFGGSGANQPGGGQFGGSRSGDTKSGSPIAPGGGSSETKSGDSKAAAKPLPRTGPSADGKLRFNARFQPWREVLEWFADQADLSLVLDTPPPGTFNYQDTKSYSPAEAIDLLNGILQTKGYTLVRRDRMLMLVNLADGVPDNLVEYVPVDELEKRGKFELVSVIFKLDKLTPEEAETEIKKLLGPQGKVSVLSKARQISVTETAGRMKTIKGVIDAVERPEGTPLENLKALPVKFAAPADALAIVKQLLNIPADRSNTSDGSLRIVADAAAKNLLVSGKAEQVAKVEDILKAVDVASAGNAALPPVEGSPQLEVYSIAGADPATVLQVLQTLLAGMPDVRLTTDPGTGHLIALARPSQHSTIKATIDQMQRDSRQIEVIRLRTVDPTAAVTSINKLFSAGGENVNPSAPKVEAELTTRQLIIRGSTTQIAQIRSMLEKMGETDIDSAVASDIKSNIRMIPLTGRSARNVLSQIEQVWPTMHKNRIRVVTPSSIGGATTDGAMIPNGAGLPGGVGLTGGASDFSSNILQRRPSATLEPLLPVQIPARAMDPDSDALHRRALERELMNRDSLDRVRGVLEPRIDLDDTRNRSRPAMQNPAIAVPRQKNAKQTDPETAAIDPITRKLRVSFAAQPLGEKQQQLDTKDSPQGAEKRAADSPVRVTIPSGVPAAKSDASTVDGPIQAAPAARDSAEIIVSVGPGGVMIASEDLEALDDFESLLKTLASRQFSNERDFTVFYLKYAKAQVVGELLEQIFTGGGSSSGGGGGGSLLGDIAGAALGDMGGGMMGSLLGLGGGGGSAPTIRASGTIAIVPDNRLNALVIQANSNDLDMVEQLLKVLDQKGSPEDVLVVAKPQLIPVLYTSAEEVAAVVRQVYADRISGGAGAQRQPSPDEFIRALRGGGGRGGRGGGGQKERTEDVQKMTVGVDTRTNSLVVSAPESLFNEVKSLVAQLDQETNGTNETMKVVTLKRSNPSAVQAALTQIVGDQVKMSNVKSPSNGASSGAANNSGGGGNAQRQRDMINALQGGGGRGFGGGGSQGGGGFQGGGGRGEGGGGGRGNRGGR